MGALPWRDSEDNVLREFSSTRTLTELSLLFTRRSAKAIGNRCRYLDLPYIKENSTEGFRERASVRQTEIAKNNSKWIINEEGRQCTYNGEGNCEHRFRSWDKFSKGRGPEGRKPWCQDCNRAYNQSKPLEERRAKNLVSSLRKYNLTVEQYQNMVDRFNDDCWLCRKPETKIDTHTKEIQRLKVDHDHACCPSAKSCGKCIRGLLCDYCNGNVMRYIDEAGLDNITKYVVSGYVNLPDYSVS